MDPYLSPFFFFSNFISRRSKYSCGNKICKHSQGDIINKLLLTSTLPLCIRLHWLDTVFLNFINKWNQRKKRAHNLLHKFSQFKCNNKVYFLVYFFLVERILFKLIFLKIMIPKKWPWKIVNKICNMRFYQNNLIKTRKPKLRV